MWTVENSKALYGLEKWSASYFDINEKGHVVVKDSSQEKHLDLLELCEGLKAQNINLPVLVRFPDILESRLKGLNKCFKKAIADMNYQGQYKGVYPVKVNQERHLVEDLVKAGKTFDMGIECGSKPELLIALASIKKSKGLIICNGFKDRDYIETALLSKKLGRETIVVVDRYSELKTILDVAKKHKIRPSIGLRAKLTTPGAGRWAESSGNKSKFGLTPNEMVWSIKALQKEDMLDCIDLLHFHIGSQIPSIQSIKGALKEGARFYAELFSMGAHPKYMDVGGGLGVNYDGSGSSDSSVNYSDQEYANDVIYSIKSICDEKSIPHPHVVTESGRALVAHSSLLIFDVLGANQTQNIKEISPITAKDHQILRDLADIQNGLKKANLVEAYNDLCQIKRDVLQLFTYGVLSLRQRALAEELINNLFISIRKIVAKNPEEFPDLIYDLDSLLCETYYCNFSLFQSLPDSWAMDQLFPVMPLHRHQETPTKRAILVDLTCDSDGALDLFVDPTSDTPQKYLEVHDLKKNQPYYMGVFLTGAYQEILGDLHNLFGDTNAVHVRLEKDGKYNIENVVHEDSISDVLKFVSFEPEKLFAEIKKEIQSAAEKKEFSQEEAQDFINKLKQSLAGSTYLLDSLKN